MTTGILTCLSGFWKEGRAGGNLFKSPKFGFQRRNIGYYTGPRSDCTWVPVEIFTIRGCFPWPFTWIGGLSFICFLGIYLFGLNTHTHRERQWLLLGKKYGIEDEESNWEPNRGSWSYMYRGRSDCYCGSWSGFYPRHESAGDVSLDPEPEWGGCIGLELLNALCFQPTFSIVGA